MGNCVSCVREVYEAPPILPPNGAQEQAPAPKQLDVVAGKVPTKGDKAVIDSNAIDSDLILNVLDHENGPAKGMPYQVHYLGPPVPPCEENRLATIRALDKMACPKPEEDPEISSILKLCTSMFQAPVALVALFDSKRVYVSGSEGNVIPCGDFPWRWTLCAWSLAYNHAQILVIPDTLQDVRFRENAKVTGYPGVRFYCGAPLVASNGHRLGTLCFADVAPRPGFDAASCSVMNNLSELVVRHLEKDIALKLKQRDNDVLKATYGQLQRTLDCFEHCVVLLDTSVAGWRVLHANSAWAKMTGVERADVLGRPLAEVFEGAEGAPVPTPDLDKAAQACYDFQVTAAKLRLASPLGNPKGGFVLTFRPAAKEGMDDSVVPIGIPAFLKCEALADSSASASPAKRFYFMSVDLSGKAMSSKASSVITAHSSVFSGAGSEIVEGLDLGHLLGKGSFGSVYYGTWRGTPVAVKVLDTDVRRMMTRGGPTGNATAEAVLGLQLRHPNVVATLKWVARKVDRPSTNVTLLTSMDSSDVNKTPKTGFGSLPDPKSQLQGSLPAPVAEEGSECAGQESEQGAWPVINFADCQVGALDEGNGATHPSNVQSNSTDWPALGASGAQTKSSGANLGANISGSALHTPKAGRASFEMDSAGGGSSMVQTWILMEFCDRGCLQEAIDRGWLRTERSALNGGPNMPAVLATAREVASALAYLHSASVVHGDLSGWNVMLCSSGAAAAEGGRGFVAKVADFGLSRTLEIRSKMQTANYGTLSHMPPELVLNGTVSRAVDVYSFGVLLWQMYTGSRPWSGLTHSQIIMLISSGDARLVFPPGTPPSYEQLMRDCTARDPEERPPLTTVVKRIEAMVAQMEADGQLE
ncbi:hypothetical protein HYH03_013566 [Edaphochlamys debaryana]|uniref:Protein kinase domain-containing protein n=1 Tax=Edaphochlamys debaryana TaxID=47281 RepID=A0A835XY77_9CHLO|nr:hypothetical protein HYH03_013566 [Edaphochlamys debaryana]|eukprot:KAG2487849.1 hypothetical protein HYH03_013566 [Edaphochlamys debaryana]